MEVPGLSPTAGVHSLAGWYAMAKFIVLKRPGPPSREVLVNIAQILTVQPGQGTGSSLLFGKDHAINFEEDVATVIRRIQSGPFIESAEKK
jgi:hypothetical protein